MKFVPRKEYELETFMVPFPGGDSKANLFAAITNLKYY